MPGAAWWVGPADRPRDPWSRGAVGNAALEPRVEPLDEATPWDLASLTKPLATALLLVLLEQEGRLDLDGPLEAHLREAAAFPLGRTTLAALARHAARLPAWAPLYLTARTQDDYVEAILRLPPAVDAGGTLYSDLGYILLGVVIERVAGHPLDECFERRIAAPLGLGRTGFAGGGRDYRDAAPTERGNRYERALAGAAGAAHAWRERVLRGEVHDANAHRLGGVAGHAGLFGPLDEVAALACEVLRPQHLALGAAARARLLDTAPAGRSVGWVAASESAAARGILPDAAPGHTGFTGTSLWLVPDAGSVSLLLTNRVHPGVSAQPFAAVRRGFHRLARRAQP